MRNLILNADSYKSCHSALYPEGSSQQFAYIAPRTIGSKIVVFGIQMAIMRHLSQPITKEEIDFAEGIITAHGLPFNRLDWEYILDRYDGYLPLTIKGFKEGSVVDSGQAIATVHCTDERLYWLTSYVETWLQRAIWYPTTIASNGYRARQFLNVIYRETSDLTADFSLHDFGARGTTSSESAEIGGLAHLVNFKGTDNLLALVAANRYYHNLIVAGFSIPATEHSVQCAYGESNQAEYIRSVLNKTTGTVSIVLDGYDIYREFATLCSLHTNPLRKVICRPDSGDPLTVLGKLLKIAEQHYRPKVNTKGYKYFDEIGFIWGDGIDFNAMVGIAKWVKKSGYAADTVVYGSGGGLLQKVTRDTYGFAQKTSAMVINGELRDVVKHPVTDSKKSSIGGVVGHKDFVTYYHNGELLTFDNFDAIRARCKN